MAVRLDLVREWSVVAEEVDAGLGFAGEGDGIGDFRVIKVVDDDEDGRGEEPTQSNLDWEDEFLGEIHPMSKRKQKEKSELLQETDSTDWCVRARKFALMSIQTRGLTSAMEDLVTVNLKKKNKKKSHNVKKKPVVNKEKPTKESLDFDSDGEDDELNIEDLLDDKDQLKTSVSIMAGGMFKERKEKTMETFVERQSHFFGPHDRRKEINLNREIVEAQTADQVLEGNAEMIMAVAKGLSPSPLSLLNLATTIHRIAKNMEKVSMTRSHRLAFAWRREMSMLVGLAMMALPECSAQGVSNITWALSKIGGELLYLSEMDRVAEVGLNKVGEFNSQNVANIAGAFASMQHAAPELVLEISKRASDIIHTFQSHELAQLLWAFASLVEPADSIFASLDDKITSSFQKEVGRLLVSTGLDWTREYVVDGYTLDAALIDLKVALEIDGPTHFSRNSGGLSLWSNGPSLFLLDFLFIFYVVRWEELEGSHEQLDYLREILQYHTVDEAGR
ncbi:hypothetical protein Ccrd_014008 [Cynara cardunculus var. scolymus]|uniref:RAP domain-containing protein n=1 Tax=Cynara cardunculus var. scolymus TaxID=59895 RepID=A0A103YEI1_CYNCS|nr:hypothetical protein Ccrd_014008 [Cynara cardunculus var. scolymus]